MIWQDIAISIAGVVFALALIPQVYCGFKEKSGPIKLQTSIPTFVGIFIIVIAYITLTLYLSAFISFLTGILWFLLFVQRIIYKK
ncbi:MAG: hypothetical protein ABIH87_01410 [bacterium]